MPVGLAVARTLDKEGVLVQPNARLPLCRRRRRVDAEQLRGGAGDGGRAEQLEHGRCVPPRVEELQERHGAVGQPLEHALQPAREPLNGRAAGAATAVAAATTTADACLGLCLCECLLTEQDAHLLSKRSEPLLRVHFVQCSGERSHGRGVKQPAVGQVALPLILQQRRSGQRPRSGRHHHARHATPAAPGLLLLLLPPLLLLRC